MSNKVEYKNTFGELISDQQTVMIKDYNKEFYIDNNLKKIEFYINNNINSVHYYQADNEPINTILSNYNSIMRVSFFKLISTQNSYKEVSVKTYKEGVLINETILIEDNQGNTLYDKTINSANNSVLTFEKYYYQNNTLKYIFSYFENGDVRIINIYDDLDSEEIHHSSGGISNFDWVGLEYYEKGIQKFPS